MKSLFIKIIFSIFMIFAVGCKAQTVNDYITFYNSISPKLNTLANNKSQYIGQNFSLFSNALLANNVSIDNIGYHLKTHNSKKYFSITLYFCTDKLFFIGSNQKFQVPVVWVTFENEIPSSIKSMVLQYEGVWNFQFEQFFANMKIEKIEFIGINGYDNLDRTPK
ncbi:hypothetical protein [Amniculibacterium sp. G2-70]|uniref:hypothetical protein n=1 Tax=Amniculibacterium sp. G2-70 TaxID=2767188 RepID=UPI0016544F49|nr:hypothetical protein [Amniculibacterium sp. G2-70]